VYGYSLAIERTMKLSRQIEVLFQAGTAAGESDGQLLDRFVQARDEAAFAALVDRHGAMVLRVCRQVLVDEHDAQDASQATFLVLARRAGAIHGRESVASWLHGVALRVAAKARVAAARRRAHERRGGGISATRHAVDSGLEGVPDHERWQWLHDELDRLPETFRSPLVLCYLEGLTQEQAAAQLRCPLGTVQSRLARGRAKLKSRLEERNMNRSATYAWTTLTALQPAAPLEAWAEATVRLALRFTADGPLGATAGETAITLADSISRTMAFAKLKLEVGLVLIAAFMTTGAAVWAGWEGRPGLVPLAMNAQKSRDEQQALPLTAKAPEAQRKVKRMVRGIVRDAQGRPVAKAWVGSEVEPMLDVWMPVRQDDRLRVTQTPFRDVWGQVVPTGSLGRYYEYRNDEGRWQPVDPTDIRRVNIARLQPFMSRKERETVKKAPEKTFLEVRVAKERQRMVALDTGMPTASRTDAQGDFAVEATFSLPRYPAVYLHFASPDFRQEQAVFVGVEDQDHAIEITLKPTRPVRARFIETPADNEIRRLEWNVYAAGPIAGAAGASNANDGWGAWWGQAPTDPPEPESPRRLELNLAAGRYKVLFRGSTIERTVRLEVPAGEGPVELPEIRLESLAWFKMLGHAAAEIDAVDRDGRPVKLADYRGKVILLTFLERTSGEPKELPAQLIALLQPLERQPLEILAIHDASVISLEEFRNKRAPIIESQFAPGKVPCRPLLDRPPPKEGSGPNGLRADDLGSGLTAAAFELVEPACFVIDKNGRLVFALMEAEERVESFRLALPEERNVPPGYLVEKSSDAFTGEADVEKRRIEFAAGEIDRALRQQLGLAHAPDPDPFDVVEPLEDFFWKPTIPKDGLVIRGKVVGPDGKGLSGVLVSPILNQVREKEVKTLPSGEFSFTIDEAHSDLGVRVEAPGLATKAFWMSFQRKGKDQEQRGETGSFVEADGLIPKPLEMGPGAVVTGRVVRDGKPVAGITMVVQPPATIVVREGSSTPVRPLQNREANTDERGYFRIPFVPAELECSIYIQPGGLANHQTIIPRSIPAGRDGTTIDLGEFEVSPGRKLAGRVILADGKAPSLTAKLVVWPEHGAELTGDLDATGRFEVNGVPDGRLVVYVTQKIGIGIVSDLPGYHISARNKCLDPTFPDRLQGTIKEDITNLTIGLDPGEAPEGASTIPFGIDPARVADFEEAKAGPITGVAPR
jgi:RNA polymerase sigma factor (sigma-70 family)